MKLSSLRDFLTAAEIGSLRAAARKLGISQPAITRSIQELERELGVALFQREARGIRLTPMGEVFRRRAASAQNDLRQAKDEIAQMRGESYGRIRVCVSSASHFSLLPLVLKPFHARFPGVTLDIMDAVFPDVERHLKEGTVDCYIGPFNGQPVPELVCEKLFDNTRKVFGRKNHPLAQATTLHELADAGWIVTRATHPENLQLAEDWELGPLFAKHGLPPPKLVVRAHSALTYLISLAYSDLLMVMPIQWAHFPLWHDVLAPIEIKEIFPTPPVCVLRRSAVPLTPAAEHFCDLIRRASGHIDHVNRF